MSLNPIQARWPPLHFGEKRNDERFSLEHGPHRKPCITVLTQFTSCDLDATCNPPLMSSLCSSSAQPRQEIIREWRGPMSTEITSPSAPPCLFQGSGPSIASFTAEWRTAILPMRYGLEEYDLRYTRLCEECSNSITQKKRPIPQMSVLDSPSLSQSHVVINMNQMPMSPYATCTQVLNKCRLHFCVLSSLIPTQR
jgi:hypothetical protein